LFTFILYSGLMVLGRQVLYLLVTGFRFDTWLAESGHTVFTREIFRFFFSCASY